MKAMAARMQSQPGEVPVAKTLAYNLKRVLNLVSLEKLMAAVS